MKRKSLTVISVPYDSAHFNERMGAGPRHIVSAGLIRDLKAGGYDVRDKEILLKDKFPAEIRSTFHLLMQIKTETIEALQKQSFPIVLSGNCCATVGVVSGINSADTGVIWFDAHGDCETAETTASGFLDGMGLCLLINKCWNNLLSSSGLNTSLTGKNIILIGARDLSIYEKTFIDSNGIRLITVEEIKRSYQDTIEAACAGFIQAGIKKIHFHIDADVIDPSVAIANSYSVINGLNTETVIKTINYFKARIPVTSVIIASYDPSFDTDGKMLRILNEFIETILNNLISTKQKKNEQNI